jgi:hypothetical protein
VNPRALGPWRRSRKGLCATGSGRFLSTHSILVLPSPTSTSTRRSFRAPTAPRGTSSHCCMEETIFALLRAIPASRRGCWTSYAVKRNTRGGASLMDARVMEAGIMCLQGADYYLFYTFSIILRHFSYSIELFMKNELELFIYIKTN